MLVFIQLATMSAGSSSFPPIGSTLDFSLTGSELFSILTCPNTTIFTFLSIFSSLEMSDIKILETIRS